MVYRQSYRSNTRKQEANCVKLITTYSSKGLESPVVIIADGNQINIDKCNIILENKLCILNRTINAKKKRY